MAAIRLTRQHQDRAARICTAAAGAGAVLLLMCTTALRARTPPLPEPAYSVLLRDVGFSQGQLVLARNGQIVVKLLPTPQPKEVAVAGVTRIAVTREQFFDRYRDIERFKQHEAVKQLGRFSQPPDAGDLARLEFSPDMLDDLRTCQPGDCKVKLPQTWMTKLREHVNWSSASARTDAQDLFRALLSGYVADYQTNGASALVEYRDKQAPAKLA